MKKIILSLALIACSSYVHTAENTQGESLQTTSTENATVRAALSANSFRRVLHNLSRTGKTSHTLITIGAAASGFTWFLSEGEVGSKGAFDVMLINMAPFAIAAINHWTFNNETVNTACTAAENILGLVEGGCIIYGLAKDIAEKRKRIILKTQNNSIATDIEQCCASAH